MTPLNTKDNGAEYDKILNEFYDEIEPISRDVPYMVAVGMSLPAPLSLTYMYLTSTLQGNHEANCDNGGDLTICVPGQLNFTGYRAHWK